MCGFGDRLMIFNLLTAYLNLKWAGQCGSTELIIIIHKKVMDTNAIYDDIVDEVNNFEMDQEAWKQRVSGSHKKNKFSNVNH